MAVTDLVLEGGGAKLPGLAGAVCALSSAGYSTQRIAGTSAGAIVGALTTAGIPANRLINTILDQDFTDFEDLNPAFRFAPWLGKTQGLLFHKGMYLGTALYNFLDEILAAQGIRHPHVGRSPTARPRQRTAPGTAVQPCRHRLRCLPRTNAAPALGLSVCSRSRSGFTVGRGSGLRLGGYPVLLQTPITASQCTRGRWAIGARRRRWSAVELPRRRLRSERSTACPLAHARRDAFGQDDSRNAVATECEHLPVRHLTPLDHDQCP